MVVLFGGRGRYGLRWKPEEQGYQGTSWIAGCALVTAAICSGNEINCVQVGSEWQLMVNGNCLRDRLPAFKACALLC